MEGTGYPACVGMLSIPPPWIPSRQTAYRLFASLGESINDKRPA